MLKQQLMVTFLFLCQSLVFAPKYPKYNESTSSEDSSSNLRLISSDSSLEIPEEAALALDTLQGLWMDIAILEKSQLVFFLKKLIIHNQSRIQNFINQLKTNQFDKSTFNQELSAHFSIEDLESGLALSLQEGLDVQPCIDKLRIETLIAQTQLTIIKILNITSFSNIDDNEEKNIRINDKLRVISNFLNEAKLSKVQGKKKPSYNLYHNYSMTYFAPQFNGCATQ